jgi:hypothetical protein
MKITPGANNVKPDTLAANQYPVILLSLSKFSARSAGYFRILRSEANGQETILERFRVTQAENCIAISKPDASSATLRMMNSLSRAASDQLFAATILSTKLTLHARDRAYFIGSRASRRSGQRPVKSRSGKYGCHSRDNRKQSGTRLSSFEHQVGRVLRGLVLRHRKSKSAQVKTGKQCFSLTQRNR